MKKLVDYYVHLLFSLDVVCVDEGTDATEIVIQEIEPDIIPNNLWNIFPPNGQYLRNLMEFTGYQSRVAILSLRHDQELKNMLQFAIDMHEGLDEEDKKKIFGPFSKVPQKLRILPGLDKTFKQFLKLVEDLNPDKKSVALREARVSEKAPRKKKKEARSAPYQTVETLTKKMVKWFKKKGQQDVEDKFEIVLSHNLFSGKCKVCGTDIDIIGFSLSNFQKHSAMSCWMNPAALEKKKKKGKIPDEKVHSISAYLTKPTTTSMTSSNSAASSSTSSADNVEFQINQQVTIDITGDNTSSDGPKNM